MTKNLFVILIAVVLVLAIVVGVISALNVPEGGGNIIDNIIGNGSETTGSDVTTLAPEPNVPAPAYEGQIKYLEGSEWITLDYSVGYEPEYASDNAMVGYNVFVRVKLRPNFLYNIAFDCSELGIVNPDVCCRYYDVIDNEWKAASDGSLEGAISSVNSDENGFIKFSPYYNYASQIFPTASAAAEFVEALKVSDFSIMISASNVEG